MIFRLFFFNEINTFMQQGYIKLSKSDSKDFYNITEDFYLKNKNKKKEIFHQRVQKRAAQQFLTLLIRRNYF